VTSQSLAGLKPVFPNWGKTPATTAGNASGIGDAAGLCVMMTRERAEKEGFEILGKWVGSEIVGVEPRYMGISPIAAVPKILKRFGLTQENVDIFEVRTILYQERCKNVFILH
jgi:acetyl-CoA acyltransferase 1